MRPNLHVAIIFLCFLVCPLSNNHFAQSPQKERPKLKEFGSSLKRLRWDPKTNTAVEIKQSNQSTANSDNDEVVRIDTNLVACDLLVTDSQGRLVNGLTAEDFIVTEDGEPQKVEHFVPEDHSLPLSIVLIIDYSPSQTPYLRTSVNAAKVMVDKLRPSDVMAIVTDDVQLLVDFTNDKGKLKKGLESLLWRTKNQGVFSIGSPPKFGKSLQYSALMATLKEAFIQEDLRPVIVFQTDGDQFFGLRGVEQGWSVPPDLPEDLSRLSMNTLKGRLRYLRENPSEFGLDDIHRAVEKSRATVYTVVSGYRVLDRTPDEQVKAMKNEVELRLRVDISAAPPGDRDIFLSSFKKWRTLSPKNLEARAHDTLALQTALASVAPRSGGWTEFLETPDQAEGIYSRIFADINQRYVVGYYPTNKAHDGQRRKIKFEVKGHSDYHILGRTAYYAPSP